MGLEDLGLVASLQVEQALLSFGRGFFYFRQRLFLGNGLRAFRSEGTALGSSECDVKVRDVQRRTRRRGSSFRALLSDGTSIYIYSNIYLICGYPLRIASKGLFLVCLWDGISWMVEGPCRGF